MLTLENLNYIFNRVDIIRDIIYLNRTATVMFLDQFTNKQLEAYLHRLKDLKGV